MIALQTDLDLEVFDSSLGCPLSTYQDATLALVGGKSLQCWRLAKFGFPVPISFVLPTYVYSLHIGEAGVVELINEVFTNDLTNETVREEAKGKLDTIRQKIISTPLNDDVIENLESFLDTLNGSPVAVRSSGSAEDLSGQSFAGQYDTYLYKKTIEEVCDAVKACWASMFKSHILDYAARAVFLSKKDKNALEASVFNPLDLKAPKMGVLIMKMAEARASGVCFTRNIWGEKNEIMVEAVLGQGEGLVSGEITPDRYVLDKYSASLCYQQLTEQTHKFVRSSNAEGVEKVTIDEPMDGPVLSRKELKVSAALALCTTIEIASALPPCLINIVRIL